MNSKYIKLGATLILLGVVAGAFGAHFIESHYGQRGSDLFETASRYQIYHGFAILICGILWQSFDQTWIRRAVRLFLFGIFCFSGSIYLLVFKDQLGGLSSFIGPITPIGGLLFITAWVFLILSIGSTKD